MAIKLSRKNKAKKTRKSSAINLISTDSSNLLQKSLKIFKLNLKKSRSFIWKAKSLKVRRENKKKFLRGAKTAKPNKTFTCNFSDFIHARNVREMSFKMWLSTKNRKLESIN